MYTLFYQPSSKTYFFAGDEGLRCDVCKAEILPNNPLVIHKSYTRKEAWRFTYCPSCVGKHRKMFYDEFTPAQHIDMQDLPENCHMVMDAPPELRSGTATVFTAVFSNEGITANSQNCQLVDHTKLAAREETTQEQLIKKDETPQLELKTEQEVDNFLNDLKEAEPITEETKNKLLQ